MRGEAVALGNPRAEGMVSGCTVRGLNCVGGEGGGGLELLFAERDLIVFQ